MPRLTASGPAAGCQNKDASSPATTMSAAVLIFDPLPLRLFTRLT